MIARILDYLTYQTPIYTERFQLIQLIVNYSILALALVFYLVGVWGTWGIALGCVPGILTFLVNFQVWSWKQACEGTNPVVEYINQMRKL